MYHLTPARNLPSILRKGLRPRRGPRSRLAKEPGLAVYLFPDLEALETAATNWVAEVFPETTPLALLRITLPPSAVIDASVAWERSVTTPVPPEHVVVVTPNYVV